MGKNYLVISDLQIPFEHEKALAFCKYLKKHYSISDDMTYCVGDEIDGYWGSQWKKDIEANHTALSEIKESKERLKGWYDAFPKMKLAESNHGSRWLRKALQSDIPSIFMRRYQEVLGCPDTWKWQKRWHIDSKYPFVVEHGDDFGSQYPHVQAALNNAKSTVIGHFHTIAGVEFIRTNGFNIWACASGSLIDETQYAFNYAKNAKRKAQIGCVVVINEGKLPIWIPLD